MKYRTDFVTNSSSSSFIMAFCDEKTMFDEMTYNFARPEEVKKDLQKAIRLTKEDTIALIEHSIYYHTKWDLEHEMDRNDENFERELDKRIQAVIDKFDEETKDKTVFIELRYGSDTCDDDIEYSLDKCNCCYLVIDHH